MTEPAASPRVEQYTDRGVEVIVVRAADIYEAEVIDRVGRELKRAVEAAAGNRFVLDLGSVKFLSSSALGILISVQRRVVHRKGELRLAGVRAGVLELFALSRLDSIFPIFPDVASAVEAFHPGP